MTDPPPVPPARFGLLSLPQDPIFDILSQSAIGCRELCQLEGSCTTIRQMIAGARPRDIAEVRGKRSVQVLYKCRHSIPSLLPDLLPGLVPDVAVVLALLLIQLLHTFSLYWWLVDEA